MVTEKSNYLQIPHPTRIEKSISQSKFLIHNDAFADDNDSYEMSAFKDFNGNEESETEKRHFEQSIEIPIMTPKQNKIKQKNLSLGVTSIKSKGKLMKQPFYGHQKIIEQSSLFQKTSKKRLVQKRGLANVDRIHVEVN